jgi:hypothetical protein
MPGHERRLRDVVALLEKPRRTLVPQVVKVQIGDAERVARSLELIADPLGRHRKDAVIHSRLSVDERESVTEQRAPLVIAGRAPRMLPIPDQH